jgi:hypothetical protein
LIEDTPYRGLFHGLRQRMRAYRNAQQSGKMLDDEVMVDLFKFSHFFDDTDGALTTEEVLVLRGRQQVIRRILQHTRLTAEELFPILQGLDEETRIALFDNRRGIPLS